MLMTTRPLGNKTQNGELKQVSCAVLDPALCFHYYYIHKGGFWHGYEKGWCISLITDFRWILMKNRNVMHILGTDIVSMSV